MLNKCVFIEKKSNYLYSRKFQGGFKQAKKDFYSLSPKNIYKKDNGTIVGELKDGRTANLRELSSERSLTLELTRVNSKSTIKIRY